MASEKLKISWEEEKATKRFERRLSVISRRWYYLVMAAVFANMAELGWHDHGLDGRLFEMVGCGGMFLYACAAANAWMYRWVRSSRCDWIPQPTIGVAAILFGVLTKYLPATVLGFAMVSDSILSHTFPKWGQRWW